MYLVPMAEAGRKFIILFDHETKPKTRWSVFQALHGKLFSILAIDKFFKQLLLIISM
ncbi:DUF3854 domain-containing protein [Nostoc sp. CHAB 5836]|uniref:DUF3854 domain-containing protein n=1 Tax=Nostoc sp. CHAB 5836 TaxID=2780404 RepID=UPI0034D95D59|nr:DUF3854 domain-containing protein [Nostoc sp. CHAB 5836]